MPSEVQAIFDQISALEKQARQAVLLKGWSCTEYADLLLVNLQRNIDSLGLDGKVIVVPKSSVFWKASNMDSILNNVDSNSALPPPSCLMSPSSPSIPGKDEYTKAQGGGDCVSPDHVPDDDSDESEFDQESEDKYVEMRLNEMMGGTLSTVTLSSSSHSTAPPQRSVAVVKEQERK